MWYDIQYMYKIVDFSFLFILFGGLKMTISYKKLWHILLDRNLHKKDLMRLTGVSPYTIKRLTKNENVSTEVLCKISKMLGCRIDDIVEYSDEKEK